MVDKNKKLNPLFAGLGDIDFPGGTVDQFAKVDKLRKPKSVGKKKILGFIRTKGSNGKTRFIKRKKKK